MNRVPLDALIDSACKVYMLDRDTVTGGHRQSRGAFARRAVVYLAIGEGYTKAELARALDRHTSTICETLEYAKDDYGVDPGFTDRVKAIWSNVAELV